MRCVVIHQPGGYDRLKIEERPDPVPGPGEVLIRVAAAGVNFADCIIRMGLYASAREYVGYPITPGFEAAGVVVSTGQGVSAFVPGQSVMAVTRFGGYTTHLVVPERQVFALPQPLTLEQAAGFPTVFLTAWYALMELARPRAGDTVLVHSAAGGVGSALVQLAKLAGCRVIGVVGRAHKVKAAQDLGADAVIDKSSEDLWARAEALAPGGYHAIFDANGPSTLRESFRHLAATGKLVVYGFHGVFPRHGGRPNPLRLAWDYLRTPRFNPFAMTNRNRSVMAFNLSYLFDRHEILAEGIARLRGWLAEGRLAVPATTAYPLDRVAEAQRALASGDTIGKLVLVAEEKHAP